MQKNTGPIRKDAKKQLKGPARNRTRQFAKEEEKQTKEEDAKDIE